MMGAGFARLSVCRNPMMEDLRQVAMDKPTAQGKYWLRFIDLPGGSFPSVQLYRSLTPTMLIYRMHP